MVLDRDVQYQARVYTIQVSLNFETDDGLRDANGVGRSSSSSSSSSGASNGVRSGRHVGDRLCARLRRRCRARLASAGARPPGGDPGCDAVRLAPSAVRIVSAFTPATAPCACSPAARLLLRVPPKAAPKNPNFLQEPPPPTPPCATVAVRAWFGPTPHIRGTHTHAVPEVARLTS